MGWLQRVAAAVNYEPPKATIAVYLEELSTWRLTEAQWRELEIRVRKRLMWFPKIPELLEILSEIVQEDEAKRAGKAAMARDPKVVPCPAEVKAQINAFLKS